MECPICGLINPESAQRCDCGYYFLYLQLKKRKNWARITLVIITFPYGTFYFNSQELKLYCLQKEGLEKKR